MPDNAARRPNCNADHVLPFVQAFCAEKFVYCDEQVLALCGYHGDYNQMKKLFQRQLKRTTAPFATVRRGRREYFVLHVLHFQLVLVRMRSFAAKLLHRLLSDALAANPIADLLKCTAPSFLWMPSHSAHMQQADQSDHLSENERMVKQLQQQHQQQSRQQQQLQQQHQQQHQLLHQQQHQKQRQQQLRRQQLRRQQKQLQQKHHLKRQQQQQRQQPSHIRLFHPQYRHQPTPMPSLHFEHQPRSFLLQSDKFTHQPFATRWAEQLSIRSFEDTSLAERSSRPICNWSIETASDGKTLYCNFSSYFSHK